MAGLRLLEEYDSTDEEPETETKIPKIDKVDKLPVPVEITTLYTNAKGRKEHQDVPSLHQNRKRSFPHVIGNWATCLFVDLKPYLIEDLRSVQQRLHVALNDHEVKIETNLHLSVSKVVTFQHHWIDTFLVRFRKEVGLRIKRFSLYWQPELKVFVNEEKTRTFIGLCVRSDSELRNITKLIDAEFEELNLAPFYDPPIYHVSLLWTLGDRESDLQEKLPELNAVLGKCIEDGTLEEGGFSQSVERILCKTGHKTHIIAIPQEA